MVVMGTKICHKCKDAHPLAFFHKSSKAADGLQGRCKACAIAMVAKWQRENRVRTNARLRSRYSLVRDKEVQRLRLFRETNPGKDRSYGAKYRAKNKEKERLRAKIKRQVYAATSRAYLARKRAKIKQATARWSNEFFIAEAYRLAVTRSLATGIKWQVDHIVPLNSSLVCGLHVEGNLAVIPKDENMKKGNRYWPDMP